ncbi:hypothetical protein SUGI_1062990 [Cryptomeria japonica]|nr:hypothetical protein SUGI_1062990 [Cryptomeria japonica]
MNVEYADAKSIIVGGNEGWHYGYNYDDWVSKAGKICVNDFLVFKYSSPPSSPFPHSVVLLKNIHNYRACILSPGRVLAGPTQGSGGGYAFKLKKHQNYCFACGMGNATHCNAGLMKFCVKPKVLAEC